MRSVALATMVLALLPCSAGAMQAGASVGKVNVSPQMMAGHCITMVSPNYPQTAGDLSKASSVLVHVVISRSGSVSPIRAVSGPPALQAEAMNAVRLWRYKPFLREEEPIDVTTDVRVDFSPGKPGGIVSHPNH
jgi:periplasmic protein TonB